MSDGQDRCRDSNRSNRPTALPWMVAFAAIALCLAMNASAHGGGLNAEGCPNDRKRGGYRCHRGSGSSARSAAAPINIFTPAWITPAPARASRNQAAYANCTEARAAGAALVRRGEPGYGPHLDRDGDGWRGGGDVGVMLM